MTVMISHLFLQHYWWIIVSLAGKPACFSDVCSGRTIIDLFTSQKRYSEDNDR